MAISQIDRTNIDGTLKSKGRVWLCCHAPTDYTCRKLRPRTKNYIYVGGVLSHISPQSLNQQNKGTPLKPWALHPLVALNQISTAGDNKTINEPGKLPKTENRKQGDWATKARQVWWSCHTSADFLWNTVQTCVSEVHKTKGKCETRINRELFNF